MTDQPHENESSIIRFDGVPHDSALDGEEGRWSAFKKAFKEWFIPAARRGGLWAAAGTELATEYAKAKVAQENNRAIQLAEDAVRLAAETDRKVQETMRLVNHEISEIFGNKALPLHAKLLQLENLKVANPKLCEQIEKISEMMSRLEILRGTKVEIRSGKPKINRRKRRNAIKRSSQLPPPKLEDLV